MLSTLYVLNRLTTYTRPVLIDLVAWDFASEPCCKVLKSMYPSRGRHDSVGTWVGLLRCRESVHGEELLHGANLDLHVD